MKILITEDKKALTEIWKRRFRRDHEVYIANSKKEAIVLLDQHPDIDLLFLDLRLNGFESNGLHVYSYFRNVLNSKCPVVIITGLEENVDLFIDAVKVVESDDNSLLLKKPVSLNDLDGILQHGVVNHTCEV